MAAYGRLNSGPSEVHLTLWSNQKQFDGIQLLGREKSTV